MAPRKQPGEYRPESELLEKGLPCEACGDEAKATYSDGHTWCYACKLLVPPGKTESAQVKKQARAQRPFQDELADILATSEHRALPKWGITQATCRHWDYRVRINSRGEGEHFSFYKDDAGQICFIKVRNVGTDGNAKEFYGIGDQSKVSLYGIERVGSGGKMIVVAEGEKDTLTASQLWGNKWPVVGIPFGAESSEKAFARGLDRVAKYDKVVLALDMDRAGRDGAQGLARMLPPGRAAIAELSSKDINQTFLDEGPEKLISALYNAPSFRPDGIVSADQLVGLALAPTVTGISLPWPFLTKWTYGLRPGEIMVLGGGTGIGKTDFGAEVAAHWLRPKADGGEESPVAVFNYEASPVATMKAIAGKMHDRRFHIPDPEHVYWEQSELVAALDYLTKRCAKLFVNAHNGAVSWEAIKDRARYLRHAENVRLFIVDPLAALVAAEDDDRKALDRLFAEAKPLAEELGINLLFFSHLTRPSFGPSHEEGGRVELKHFRGSNAIGMWASFVLGIERNQQAEDETERKTSTIRMLKDRFSGDSTGSTHKMVYNSLTGRLEEPVLALDQDTGPAELPS